MRLDNFVLEKVDSKNLAECGIGCLVNRDNRGFRCKAEWMRRNFTQGLRLLMFRNEQGRPLGFLEYVPGEHAWRPVDAKGWLFVHCLWVYPRGQKFPGLGSRLIQACLEEAREIGAIGVAAMTSDGPFIAGKDIFLKNGFRVVAEADRFELVACQLREGPQPRFRDITGNAAHYPGLHVVYCAQCPMLPKSVNDISETAAEYGLNLNVTVLDSARAAQNAPSYYGVFSLLWNSRLLSDHYVSKTRFKNLLRQKVLSVRTP